MKTYYIIFLLMLLSSCNGKPSKSSSEKELIPNNDNIETTYSQIENENDSENESADIMIEYFFKTYMKDLANNPNNNEARKTLKEKYLTPEFIARLAQMEESDIDPIVDSHGFHENWIKSLHLEQSLHSHTLFAASYSTSNEWKNLIVWLAEDEEGNYLINDIHSK